MGAPVGALSAFMSQAAMQVGKEGQINNGGAMNMFMRIAAGAALLGIILILNWLADGFFHDLPLYGRIGVHLLVTGGFIVWLAMLRDQKNGRDA